MKAAATRDGAQDIYLTGSPSITFWRIVYRRHTAFASESIEQTFNGTVGFGRRVQSTLSRNGDLITTVWLEIVLKRKVANDVNGAPFYPSENFVKEYELEIGGQRIDKIYSDFARVNDELFRKDAEKEAYRRMNNFDDNDRDGAVKRFYYPLILYFNKNVGLALPLIALTTAARKSIAPGPKRQWTWENRLDALSHTRQMLVAPLGC